MAVAIERVCSGQRDKKRDLSVKHLNKKHVFHYPPDLLAFFGFADL